MTVIINGTTGITSPEVVLDNSATDGGQVVLKSSGYSNWNWDNYSGRLRAYYNVTEYFTIDTSGNVGIGTSSPSTKLHLYGATDQRIRFENTGWTKAYQIGNDQNALSFYDVTAAVERARIDSSGNLGIGLVPTSGYGALQVLATGSIVAGGIQRAIEIYDAGSGASEGGAITFSSASCPAYAAVYGTSSNPGGALVFATNSANTGYPSERARIDSSGNLLVNTTSTVSGLSARLTVSSAASSLSSITLQDTGTTYGSGTQYISFANSANASAGSIQHTASTTVNYATTSDARLKENIADSESAFATINQIKVRSYDWKEDGHHVEFGFVAQELHKHYPDAVCVGDDEIELTNPKGTWQVDYGKLTPLLVKAIQEQQAIIKTLTDRIEALEAK